MHVISGFATLEHAAQAIEIANAIAEEDRGLAERMSQTRRRDLEHNSQLIRQTRYSILHKETMQSAPIQMFTTVSTGGKIRLPRSDQNRPPAATNTVLDRQIAAERLLASPA